jgi:exopolyphosphatase/guanosine-5'-triphosphate,3'-diphosphate pyrophosphatase
MGRYAAIDIGTNSMRLLLCEINGAAIVKKDKELIITRIGKDVSATGVISDKAIRKNIEALKYFKNRADKYGAERVFAIATSAVRDALNRETFINSAKAEVGIDIKVIQGQEEAELGLKGVMSEIGDDCEKVLVIDVGGGSTELVLGNRQSIEYTTSINAGTVRMTEQFIEENPIPDSNIGQMKDKLDELFGEPLAYLRDKRIDKVIAIGGTATTIGAMYHGLSIYNPRIVHNTLVKQNYIIEIFNKLKAMDIKERYKVKGLQKERADVIPAGLFIMQYLLNSLNKEEITVSENDNLEGIIVKYIAKDGNN